MKLVDLRNLLYTVKLDMALYKSPDGSSRIVLLSAKAQGDRNTQTLVITFVTTDGPSINILSKHLG